MRTVLIQIYWIKIKWLFKNSIVKAFLVYKPFVHFVVVHWVKILVHEIWKNYFVIFMNHNQGVPKLWYGGVKVLFAVKPSHLSIKWGVSLIFLNIFPLLTQILYSSFINLLQNSPLLIYFVTGFTPFAPSSRDNIWLYFAREVAKKSLSRN